MTKDPGHLYLPRLSNLVLFQLIGAALLLAWNRWLSGPSPEYSMGFMSELEFIILMVCGIFVQWPVAKRWLAVAISDDAVEGQGGFGAWRVAIPLSQIDYSRSLQKKHWSGDIAFIWSKQGSSIPIFSFFLGRRQVDEIAERLGIDAAAVNLFGRTLTRTRRRPLSE
ncbi:MAG TPA: hypothetical protein DCM05_02195 [Elusimicrobia bacterium]|nr:hypothetical protein [Elusimicrobiota bacterium]